MNHVPTWGSIEEDTLGRCHSKLFKLFRVLDGVLHNFLQLPLDTLQATDVSPVDVGHLYHSLPQRRWVAAFNNIDQYQQKYVVTGNTPLLFSRLHTIQCEFTLLNHAHRSDGVFWGMQL